MGIENKISFESDHVNRSVNQNDSCHSKVIDPEWCPWLSWYSV